jgi:HK97 family phage portal protein
MGLWDWIGPTSLTKRRGWDALPPPLASSVGASLLQTEVKAQGPGPMMINGVSAFWTPTSAATVLTPSAAGGNSAAFACLQTIAAAIAEPELKVYRLAPGERIELERTPLGDLLARPNPYFSMDALLAYLSTSLHVEGNGYWRKLRAGNPETGNVVELWPIAPAAVEPVTRTGSGDFISFYRYTGADGRVENIPTSNIVHFRYGVDDADHRLGSSPLKRLLTEVSSDEQATRYADRLLANLAINGLTLSFDKDSPAISQAQADELKARIQSAYGGDRAGSAAVLSPGASLTALGFSPEQMDMRTLHRVPEERISAVLGVPAIVAGLGAGLDRSTYSNFAEAREAFTETKLVPFWRSLAADLTLQLVPDFAADSSVVVDFDTAEVRALQADQNALAVRLQTLTAAGILTIDEARAELGLDALPEPAAVPAEPEPEPAPAVIALPAAASRRLSRTMALAVKAAEDLPDRYAELRLLSLPDWESELVAFLLRQQARVTRRLQAGGETTADLMVQGEAILLGETLAPLQMAQLGAVSRLVMAELSIAFTVDDPLTRAYLQEAGVNIVGITDTTREAVSAALIEGQASGEGIDQLARRIRDLPAFSQARAELVARTELGHAQNTAALTSYQRSGVVVGVRVLDGDSDSACAAMNGRTFLLDQAPASLEHPNCVRAFAPLVDAADLVRSA